MAFYNTNNLHGEELKKAVADAAKQGDAIWLIYSNANKAFSPSQILKLVQKAGKQWPITSVRRSITNLEQSGKLLKLDTTVLGAYGKPEHLWISNQQKTA